MQRCLGWLLLAAGISAIALNLYGLTTGMGQRIHTKRWIPPAGQDRLLRDSLAQRRGEPDGAYFRRLTLSLHYRMRYTAEEYVVPSSENWILHLGSYLIPSFRAFEYADYRRALERGGGQCTQFAAAVFDILKRQGFRRRLIQFPKHTVVAARPRQGPEQILDADFGVVLPFSLAEVRRKPEIVRTSYAALDPETTPLRDMSRRQVAARLKRAFSAKVLSTQVDDPTPQLARVERMAYLLKWPLPIVFLLGGAVLLTRVPRTRRSPVVTLRRLRSAA